MPGKNKKGGKKYKKNKREIQEQTTLRLKEEHEGQEYAQVITCKGNCRFDVRCCDGKVRAALLCGAMRKRKFISMRDFVLVSLRDFQDGVCDIIDSYDENQSRKLKDGKHFPENFNFEEENDFSIDDDDTITFSNDIPDSSEEEEKEEEEEEEEEEDINIDDI